MGTFKEDDGNQLKDETEESSDLDITKVSKEVKRKLLKKLKKLKRKNKKKRKTSRKHETKKQKDKLGVSSNKLKDNINEAIHEKSQAYAPMTKEEWEKQHNTLKRIYDEKTGRTRLIRGSGEILEECVSKERHLIINKQATLIDGQYFQNTLSNFK